MKQRISFKKTGALLLALWLGAGAGMGAPIHQAEAGASTEESYVFAGMAPGDSYYFGRVGDVAVDGEGNVFVAQPDHQRITKLNAEGDILDEWTGDSAFEPESIAVADGIVYAAVDEDVIMAIDMASDEPIKTWTNPGMSVTGLAVDAVNDIAYATDNTYDHYSVWQLDLETGTFDRWAGFMDESETEEPFEYPTDVAVGADGDVYVADGGYRIIKLNQHGAYLSLMEVVEADSIEDVVVDGAGFVYVTDDDANRVMKLDENGILLQTLGGYGVGQGQFDSPRGIAVDTTGYVYVGDTYNDRVQKLAAADLEVEGAWGLFGTEEGQFYYPEGIAVDADGHVYVADNGNERIQMFNDELAFMAMRGGGDSEFLPFGLAVDGAGKLYMTSGSALLKYDPAVDEVTRLNGWGTLSENAWDLEVDNEGFIYVADTGRYKIVKFDSTGQVVEEFGEQGVTLDFFVASVAVDSERGIVYAAGENKIQTIDTEGTTVEESWGEPEGGAFGYITGIALDDEGNLFAADDTNKKIQKFNPDGELVASWGSQGSGEGEFESLNAIAVDSRGNVYVTDGELQRVQKFAPLTYTVSFESNGGTPIAAQSVRPGETASEPSAPTRSGYTFAGWFADSGLTESYSFETTVTEGFTLYAKWTAISNGDGAPSGNPSVPNNGEGGLQINGKPGKATVKHSTDGDGRKVTTIVAEWDQGNQNLAGEGQSPVLSLQSKDEESDVLVGELSGELLQALIDRQGAIELSTDYAKYSFPTARIDLEALLKQLGSETLPKDAVLRIEVSKASGDLASLLNDRSGTEGFKVVALPVQFKIWLTYGDAELELTKFNGYVKRSITLPSGTNLNKGLTGVVVGPDGSVRHVPTKHVSVNGAQTAEINSMTNSAYAVVSYAASFADAEKHWAGQAIHDLASRMILKGTGEGAFGPDQAITRAEFAAIAVRSLGLPVDSGSYQDAFADVEAGDWYADTVQTAYTYGLVGGYEDGTFRPQDKISREQAMKILADAMLLTGLLGEEADLSEGVEQLNGFADAASVSEWARDGVAAALDTGVVTGKSESELAPQAQVTRAEVAVMIRRLLQKSELI